MRQAVLQVVFDGMSRPIERLPPCNGSCLGECLGSAPTRPPCHPSTELFGLGAHSCTGLLLTGNLPPVLGSMRCGARFLCSLLVQIKGGKRGRRTSKTPGEQSGRPPKPAGEAPATAGAPRRSTSTARCGAAAGKAPADPFAKQMKELAASENIWRQCVVLARELSDIHCLRAKKVQKVEAMAERLEKRVDGSLWDVYAVQLPEEKAAKLERDPATLCKLLQGFHEQFMRVPGVQRALAAKRGDAEFSAGFFDMQVRSLEDVQDFEGMVKVPVEVLEELAVRGLQEATLPPLKDNSILVFAPPDCSDGFQSGMRGHRSP